MEQLGVDAARPQLHVMETARAELGCQRRRRGQHRRARRMETAQPRPGEVGGPALRHRQPAGDVVRKAGVEAGGERQAALEADAAHGVAERPFGGDVDGVRLERVEPPLDLAGRHQRQPDFRIARHRQRPEQIRAEEFDIGAERARLARDMAERAHDAVHLWQPGVGRDQNFHDQAAFCCASLSIGALSSRPCVQVMISNVPSWPSATAVQLSTQSPQLM